MKVIIFGASGMIGQGVLRECLLDDEVLRVAVVGRRSLDIDNPKLGEIIHHDFTNFSSIETSLASFDACFFCLGVSSARMSEAEYTRITYDLTLAAAQVLAKNNPGMTFVYVSGAGTDGSEKARSMWARVKGKTENALLRLPFKTCVMFRPAFIQPMHGIVSRTKLYRILYRIVGPLYPMLRHLLPGWVTTTEKVGRAMLFVAKNGTAKRILENRDINLLAGEKP